MTTITRLMLLVAALAVALATGCSSGGDDGGGDAVQADGSGDASVEAGGGAQAADDGSAGAAGGVPAVAAGVPALAPRVVRTASLRLTVPRDGFQAAVDDVRTLVAGLGGFVVGSSASQGGRGRLVQGSITVRVPGRAYDEAVRALGRVGRLEGMRDEAREVSQEFVDLEARRRHLEAVERQLLALLDRADTVPAALSVQSQLNETQLQLEQVRGRLRFLDDQTTYATITLTLRERGVAPAPAGRGWGVGDAWSDGVHAFATVAGRMFVVAAAAAPLVLLLVVAWLAARVLRRRLALPWRASRS